jgi:hypothetical protein
LVVWCVRGNEAAGVAATLVTFAAVAWTAYETAALRAVTVQQTEIEQRPFVVLEGGITGDTSFHNLGRGVALGVHLRPIEDEDRLPYFRFSVRRPLIALGAGQQKSFEVIGHDLLEGGESGREDIARSGRLVRFFVVFKDVAGEEHTVLHVWQNDHFTVA